jgi:hypothetical protein
VSDGKNIKPDFLQGKAVDVGYRRKESSVVS